MAEMTKLKKGQWYFWINASGQASLGQVREVWEANGAYMFKMSDYSFDVMDHSYPNMHPEELIEIEPPTTIGEYGSHVSVLDRMSELSGVNFDYLK